MFCVVGWIVAILHSLIKLLSSLCDNSAQYNIAQCSVNPSTAGVIISQISQFSITNVTIFCVQHSVFALMLQQWFRHLDYNRFYGRYWDILSDIAVIETGGYLCQIVKTISTPQQYRYKAI